jgi:UDP-2,3-diacylglucosamine hydrolase
VAGAPSFDLLEAPARWRVVDFISDLHLKPEEPRTFEAWSRYMAHTPADAVVILGDLFEVWVGDDAALGDSFEARCGAVLDGCSADLAFMRGNRDFLVGAAFLSRHRVRDLADPAVFTLAGQRFVLTHGDLLCTRDVAYQAFRRQVRAPAVQQAFLVRSLAERRVLARHMREQSEAGHDGVMDPARTYTDSDLVRAWLQAADAATLIHGHTHLPADHSLGFDTRGRALTQVVLSDWHIAAMTRRAEVLRLGASGERARIDPAIAAPG